MGSVYWELLGFAESDVYSCAFSLSVMNVQAYCVGLFMPAEGKAEAVTAGLEKYIEAMPAELRELPARPGRDCR